MVGKTKGTAIDPRNVEKIHKNATSIAGITDDLHRSLKDLEADIKADRKGKKDYEDLLMMLNNQKQELMKQVDKDKAWIANFESERESGAFETKYQGLVNEIQGIYDNAKEFHGRGIEMLIKEFQYHIAYKRWNDTFTAIPYRPA